MNAKRLCALVAVLLSIAMVLGFAGCTPSESPAGDPTPTPSGNDSTATPTPTSNLPPLKISAVQAYGTINPDKPKDNSLREYAEAQRDAYVGRTIEMDWWIQTTDDSATDSALSEIQMWEASGVAPFMQNSWALHWNNALAMEHVRQTGFLHDFTPEKLREYLPGYSKRLDDLEMPVEKIFEAATAVAERTPDGKMYGVPVSFDSASFAPIREQFGSTFANGTLMLQPDASYYQVYLRDDILKELYPEALTEKEMLELLVQKGSLTLDDFTNVVNFKDYDALYDYMVKVKELGKTNNGKPIVPGGGLIYTMSGMGAPDNGMRSITGWQWRWPITFAADKNHLEDSFEWRSSDLYTEMYRQINKWVNEGLLDQELFIMKDDQLQAKAVSGDYAIVHPWISDFYNASKPVAEEAGYGYVPMPLGYPFDFANFDVAFSKLPSVGMQGRSHYWSGIPEADFPDVMKVLDYYCSEINDDIKVWGHPDWYEGEGVDRRFKAGYEDLVKWAVYGGTGGQDGYYYGLTGGPDTFFSEGNGRQVEISPFGFYQGSKNPYAPMNIYPKDDPEFLGATNLLTYMIDLAKVYNAERSEYYVPDGWSDGDWGSGVWWDEYNEKIAEYTDLTTWGIEAVHSKPEEFDAKYNRFLQPQIDAGRQYAGQKAAELLKQLWDDVISKTKMD